MTYSIHWRLRLAVILLEVTTENSYASALLARYMTLGVIPNFIFLVKWSGPITFVPQVVTWRPDDCTDTDDKIILRMERTSREVQFISSDSSLLSIGPSFHQSIMKVDTFRVGSDSST